MQGVLLSCDIKNNNKASVRDLSVHVLQITDKITCTNENIYLTASNAVENCSASYKSIYGQIIIVLECFGIIVTSQKRLWDTAV